MENVLLLFLPKSGWVGNCTLAPTFSDGPIHSTIVQASGIFLFCCLWIHTWTQGEGFFFPFFFFLIVVVCTRDMGICRHMNLVHTHKCSTSIMGPHIFEIKLCYVNSPRRYIMFLKVKLKKLKKEECLPFSPSCNANFL